MGLLSVAQRAVDTVWHAARRTAPAPEHSAERWFWLPGSELGHIQMTPQDSLRLSAVWACATVISKALASCNWDVFLERENGDRVPRRRVSAYSLLNIRPNPECTAFAFKEAMWLQALVWSNFYAEIEFDLAGRPVGLWPLAPERCCLERDVDGRLVLVVRNWGRPDTILDYETEVFHLHGPGIDGLTGFDIVALAARAFAHAAAAERFGASFYHNGTQFGGLLSTDQKLGPETRDEYAKSIQEQHRGSRNAFGLLTLGHGFKYSEFSVDADKAQFVETRHLLIEEVCRFFGVPPHKIAHLVRSTFCLPADVVVATESGPKSIAAVKVGERVWSLAESGSLELKPVTRAGPTGHSRILTIRTRGRTLRCNAQHRVLVRREVFEPYRGGRGRYVAVENVRYRRAWRNLYVPAGEIVVGDHLVAVDALPPASGRAAPTREATVPFMELLGHLTGDGFYGRSKRTGRLSYFGISHAEDDDCTPHYVAAAETVFATVERYADGRPAASGTAVVAKLRAPTTTVFESIAACAELEACGVVGTAKTKRVPAWIFGLSRDLQLAWLRGYLDADGTVNAIGQIRFVSCSRALLEDVQQLCFAVGIRCGEVFGTERKSSFEGYDDTISTLYGLVLSNPAANSEIGSNDPMRRERLAAAAFAARVRAVPVYPNERNRRDSGAGLRATKVVSVEYSEDDEVFDLTVEDNHSFIANGVVVHNSNIEHQSIEFVRDALTPWAERARQEADWKLLRPWPGIRTRIETEWLAEGDAKSKAEVDSIEVQNGLVSRNEARRRRGRNSIGPEGDKLTVQVNLTTLEKIGQDPAPAEDEDPAVTAARAVFRAAALKAVRRRLRVAATAAENAADPAAFRAALKADEAEHARYLGHLVREAAASLRGQMDGEGAKAVLTRHMHSQLELLAATHEEGRPVAAAMDAEAIACGLAADLAALIER